MVKRGLKKNLEKIANRQVRLDGLYALTVLLMAVLFLTNFIDLTVSYAVYNTNMEFFLENELNENIKIDFQKWDNYFLMLFFNWLMPLFALAFIIFILAFKIETTYSIKMLFRIVFVFLLAFLNLGHIIGFISWCLKSCI